MEAAPDALVRVRRTRTQDGKCFEARFVNLDAAIRPHPKHGIRLQGRDVLLVDDVMTSGATLVASAQAAVAAGAARVDVAVVARVTKET